MVDKEEYFLKRLVITGNGFDLAHGLPTKYSDFKEYLNCYERDLGLSRQYLHFTGTSERHQHKSSFYEAISKYIPEGCLYCVNGIFLIIVRKIIIMCKILYRK